MKSKRLYYIDRITTMFLTSSNLNMKVDEIAASIGVTKKTLYNYFDSKQHLMESIVDSFLRRKIEEVRSSVLQSSNPMQLLVMVGRGMHSLFQDYPNLIGQVENFFDERSMQHVFTERRKELLDVVMLTFRKGVRQGAFESDIDVELASQLYLSGLEMVCRNAGVLHPMIATEQQLNQILFYMIKGSCTLKGLGLLREVVDIRVMAC
jgi:AcrR family transcriptional regulator